MRDAAAVPDTMQSYAAHTAQLPGLGPTQSQNSDGWGAPRTEQQNRRGNNRSTAESVEGYRVLYFDLGPQFTAQVLPVFVQQQTSGACEQA